MPRTDQNILPTERAVRTSRRATAFTVVVVLACGLFFNAGLSLLLSARPALDNSTYVAFREQWQRLVRLEEPVETLIIGDSSGRHGIDPEILDDALGTVSLNLCTMGDAAVTNPAWQLEHYIQRFGPPKRVIMVAVHDLWKRDIKLPLIPVVPLPWGYWPTMRAPLELDRAETRDVFLARFVPVYSKDQTVLRTLMHPWRASRLQIHFSGQGFASIRRSDPDLARSDFADHLKWSAPAGWRISRASHHALEAMIAMAEEYKFELFVANSPQLVGMIDDDVFGPYYREGQEFLAGLLSGSPRAHLILSPPATYPAEQMQNSDHIAKDVVEDFTRRVATAVQACEE